MCGTEQRTCWRTKRIEPDSHAWIQMRNKDTEVQAWIAAERAAAAAEAKVTRIGQAAASPEAAALLKSARALRIKADKLYRAVSARPDL